MIFAIFDGTTMGIRDSTSAKSMPYRPKIGKTVYLCNYSGTLIPTNWKRFYIFINNLPIYKSFQQQVLKLLSHDTINIPVRGRNLVKYFNDLLLVYKIF